MEMITQLLSSPAFLMIVAIVLLTLALWGIVSRATEREKALAKRLDGVEQSLKGQIELSRAQDDEQSRAAREEMGNNLRGMNDSVTRVMSEMARTQQNQLDAFAGQLRDMGRADESRANEMRRAVEERLVSYENRMERIGDVLDDKLDKNESRMERLRQTVDAQMASLQNSNDQRLEQMQRAMDERLTETLDRRLNDSFQLVSERLEQVYQGLGEMQTLASGVGDLKKVLTNVNTRGLIGEIQLGGLLAQIMTPEQYAQNVRVRPDGETVDYAVRLPEREGSGEGSLLPIDAKFPHEAYYRLLDAQGSDPDRVEALSEELNGKLIMAAERLRDQFIAPPATTDFAVLFLGSEGLYAQAIKNADLVERLQREYGVMLTGPSTLAALLNSLQMGFRTMAIEKRSEEVWALLGAVRGEFVTFAEALTRTQKRIRQASESIEDASRKSRLIEKKLENAERSRALLPGMADD